MTADFEKAGLPEDGAASGRPGPKATALAFDLGAGSGRALVGTLEAGEDGAEALRVTEIHRFPNEAIRIGEHLYWDILRLFQEIKTGIRLAFRDGFRPETLGIDTWGVDFGLLDANGELLGNPYHYRDPQTQGLIEEAVSLIGKEELFRQGGLQFMPFNTVYQLYAMSKARSPKLEAAETLLLTPDLLLYWLTGVRICEFTMATTTQLFLPREQRWNVELMRRLGIPERIFLAPVPPGTRAGRLTPAVSEELGVPAIEAIAVGTHDTESAVAAVPAGDGPFAYIVCGTWSLLGTELAEPLLSARTMELEFSNEGGAGGTYQLLKNIMGLWILQECKREWEEEGSRTTYPELVEAARNAEPFRSLIDPDDAVFYAPPDMNEAVRDFCRTTGQPVPRTPGETARCILESLAMRYRQVLEQAESLTGESYAGLHMVGGGIQNELLCQFAADALGRPVWAGPVEASAIGNMLLQFIATGKCANLREARRLSARSFPVRVYDPQRAEQWNAAYERYTALQAPRA
ncbi:rhamnulokinase [Cohnella algarum]|uniref:rhamnulokinase n=1 Tax=Cohnella algarum TaxID=2044859 RepID=UPI001967DF90|nr:rhamnulokinase family protein [Cohnella algarum]MBN2983855.1 rhamnulokinase [Cohnella algarum]